MDISEVYAKMSREAWGDDESYVPQVGDYAIRYIETSNQVGLVSMNRDQGIEHLYWHTLDKEDGLTLREPQTILTRLIPLYRQDQLQEMVGGWPTAGFIEWVGWLGAVYGLLCQAKPAGHLNLFLTGEQLWLAFVMKEKHGKVWDGSEWQPTKP